MKPWLLDAMLAAAFAGATGVAAKLGLNGISGEVGLVVRTVLIGGLVSLFALITLPAAQFRSVSWNNGMWLALSALLATCSWIFYFRALKVGDVSKIALIDKAGILVAVFLGWAVLKEEVTWKTFTGGGLVLAGVYLISKSRA